MLEAVVDTATVRAVSRRVRVISRGCRLTVWVYRTLKWRTDKLGRGVWELLITDSCHRPGGARLGIAPSGWTERNCEGELW